MLRLIGGFCFFNRFICKSCRTVSLLSHYKLKKRGTYTSLDRIRAGEVVMAEMKKGKLIKIP